MRHGGPFPGGGTKPDRSALGPPLCPLGARGWLLFRFTRFTRYDGVLWFAPLSHFLGREVEPKAAWLHGPVLAPALEAAVHL